MVLKGKIIKIISAPSFKFHQWWVDVKVLDETGAERKTFVTGRTKLEVIQNSKLNNEIDFAC